MPDQRMLHPQQSTSRKVSALTDFDYRVWEQTKLSSDDFGVMPFDALTLRAENARLKRATEKQVAASLQQLVTVGLLIPFEHQDLMFACAPVWQTWQTVRHPRKTHLPKPPAAVLEQCDAATRQHFDRHPGGKRFGKDDGVATVSQQSPVDVAAESQQSRDRARGDTHANANAHASAPVLVSSSEGSLRGTVEARGAMPRSAAGMTPMEWHRKHASVHITEFCDWCCLPNDLADELARKVPGDFSTNRAAVVEWARHVKATWRGIIGDRFYDFWNHRWTETHGSSKPRASAAVDPLAGIREAIRG